MKKETVQAVQVSPARFSRFGRVVSRAGHTPAFASTEFDFYHALVTADFGGNVALSMVDSRDTSKVADTFERHFKTPELMVPMDNDIVIVVGEKSKKGLPGIGHYEAFVVPQGSAVLIDAGVWHFAPFPVRDSSRILIGFREGTPDSDVEILKTSEELGLVLEAVIR